MQSKSEVGPPLPPLTPSLSVCFLYLLLGPLGTCLCRTHLPRLRYSWHKFQRFDSSSSWESKRSPPECVDSIWDVERMGPSSVPVTRAGEGWGGSRGGGWEDGACCDEDASGLSELRPRLTSGRKGLFCGRRVSRRWCDKDGPRVLSKLSAQVSRDLSASQCLFRRSGGHTWACVEDRSSSKICV